MESDPVLRDADTESDCMTDRAAALDEQKVWTISITRIQDLTINIPINIMLSIANQFSHRMLKHGMFPNARPMDVINEFNVIVLLDIVGVLMKILVKTREKDEYI